MAIFGTLELDTINHKTKIKKLVNGTNNSTDKVNANITVDNNKTLAGTTSVAPLNNLPTSLIATPTGINVNPNIPTISTSAVTNTIPPITITPGINLQPIPIQNTPTAITNPNPIPNINPPSTITSLPPITAPTSLTIPTPPFVSTNSARVPSILPTVSQGQLPAQPIITQDPNQFNIPNPVNPPTVFPYSLPLIPFTSGQ